MPIFQYQSRTQPVSVSPETVTVDRWLPTLTQPVRVAVSVALMAAGTFAPVPVAPAVTPIPSVVAPVAMASPVRPITSGAPTPAYTGPETTTVDRWNPTYPSRLPTPKLPPLDQSVEPIAPPAAAVPTLSWQGTQPQPLPTGLSRPRGETVAPVALDLSSLSWLSAQSQPLTIPVRPRGVTVAPVLVIANSVPSFGWYVTQPQPDRTPLKGPATWFSPSLIETAAPPPILLLGRFRAGDLVPVVLVPTSVPDNFPQALINGTSYAMPVSSLNPLTFTLFYRVPVLTLGSYPIAVSYTVGGVAHTASFSFTAIAGGDQAGPVVQFCSADRVGRTAVLAQTGSGVLVTGSNPH